MNNRAFHKLIDALTETQDTPVIIEPIDDILKLIQAVNKIFADMVIVSRVPPHPSTTRRFTTSHHAPTFFAALNA